MGLAGFNRARRSRLEVEKHEAERFKKDNEARWASHHALDDNDRQQQKDLDKGRKLESEASELIGQKVEDGIEQADNGGIIDEQLRRDHAAEIAGRIVTDPQGEPKDPVQLVEDRVPSGTATEELVMHTQVDQPGPPADLVKAAVLEQTPEADRDAKEREIDADAKAAKLAKDKIDADAADVASKAEAAAVPAEKTAEREETKAAAEVDLPSAGKSAGVGTETSQSSAVTTKKTTKK